ncbi:MAG: hypothetical protein OEQ29_21745 [Alphaproteobacteria bacterium]|nr:hypothetical protein [Alphaproteobacteria bacterium]
MAFGVKLRCTRCGATDFTFRHPSGRPRCALCGTFAHGPAVAHWRQRRKFAIIGLVLSAAAIAVWLLGLG